VSGNRLMECSRLAVDPDYPMAVGERLLAFDTLYGRCIPNELMSRMNSWH